eukprot:NODE_5_length_72347_cov_1.339331.p51 type:complete len:132 gc:universal NODE_5_length_72347_cov_1.339331:51787-51392(-)
MILLSIALMKDSLIEVKFINSDNCTVTLVKAQSPLQKMQEDYFDIHPKPAFIGRKIKWDLDKAETVDIPGNSMLVEHVNLTTLYSNIIYPANICTKFPIHVKKDNKVTTNYSVKSNVLHVGEILGEKQFKI